jgi:hypothetical protein
MPSNSGGARSDSGNLVANTVATVTFAVRYDYVEVRNLTPQGGTEDSSTADVIYISSDGTTPTYEGQDFDSVGPGESVIVPKRTGKWCQAATAINVAGGGISGCSFGGTAAQNAIQGLAAGSATGSASNPGTTVKLISGTATTPEYSVIGVG